MGHIQRFHGRKTISYNSNDKSLNRIVYGWYLYRTGTAYEDFDYSLLSDVPYFSYEVNSQTDEPDDIYFRKTTNIVNKAHAAGSCVHLTATLFSDHESFSPIPMPKTPLSTA